MCRVSVSDCLQLICADSSSIFSACVQVGEDKWVLKRSKVREEKKRKEEIKEKDKEESSSVTTKKVTVRSFNTVLSVSLLKC